MNLLIFIIFFQNSSHPCSNVSNRNRIIRCNMGKVFFNNSECVWVYFSLFLLYNLMGPVFFLQSPDVCPSLIYFLKMSFIDTGPILPNRMLFLCIWRNIQHTFPLTFPNLIYFCTFLTFRCLNFYFRKLYSSSTYL